MNKLIPLADRVLVKRLVAKAQTASGILLPETSVAKANQGTVLAVGPGRMDSNGKLIPMNCKVGDRVLLPEYGGTPFKVDEEEYTLFCDCDILGKFN
ncbi:Cpn10 [Blastocystis sp. ATCC 50177/Nand II]|uniref:Cpn10 n=1 Tax=Blastocystis sp. subtype 1 (strain ATCC 50177 / NandII) TaxID=478820 RepID=A0A196SLI5_BLAHN|nr:Cpn10 [Blastocystis sp. ATCC 50177/Nand II]